MKRIEGTKQNRRSLLVTEVQRLTVFLVHGVAQFDEPHVSCHDIVQQFVVECLCRAWVRVPSASLRRNVARASYRAIREVISGVGVVWACVSNVGESGSLAYSFTNVDVSQ